MNNRFSFIIVFILSFIIFFRCTEQGGHEKILVKIGDRTISADEFIRRAEYTIRPPYCSSNSYVHKKIVLNSLIAEKIMALEAGNENSFLETEKVKNRLLGRKEQAMKRCWRRCLSKMS